MSAHFQFGNELLRADVRAQALTIAGLVPEATVSVHISATELVALLGNAPTVAFVPQAPVAAPAPVVTQTVTAPVVAPVAPTTAAAAETATTTRFRRTKAETDAGLSVEQAQAFRASGQTDPVAFAASLVGEAEDAVDAKLEAAETPAPTPAPTAAPAETPAPAPTPAPASNTPPVITEEDVRAAAVKGVQGGKKAEVIAIAKEYGVSDWKLLDPSKYQEVLAKLTGLFTVG